MKYALSIILILVQAIQSHSQDSLLSHVFHIPVVVSGTSVTATNFNSLRTHFEDGDLGRLLFSTGQAYTNSYGPPGAATMLRHSGMSPDHSVISWNGISLNSPTLGMADCSLVPSFFMDQLHAGQDRGAGFKPSALANVVSVKSDIEDQEFAQFTGSYNTLNNSWNAVKANVSGKKVSTSFRAFMNENRNRFQYNDIYRLGRPRVMQEHNDNSGWGTMLSANYLPNKNYAVRLDWWNVDRAMSLPAKMGHISGRDEAQEDAQQRLMLRFSCPGTEGGHWGAELVSAIIRDDQFFTSAGNHELDLIQSHTESLRLLNGITTSATYSHWTLNSGVMHQLWQAEYDDLNRISENFMTGYADVKLRRTGGISSLWTSWESRENKNFPDAMLKHSWTQVRNGLQYVVTTEAGVISRVPDMNERYWQPGGNPGLLPELNRTARLVFNVSTMNVDQLNWEISLSPFANVVTNWIQWIPGDGNIWTPVNFRHVRSAGAELKSATSIIIRKSVLLLSSTFAFTEARGSDQGTWKKSESFAMIYTPRNRYFLSVEFRKRGFSMGTSAHVIAKRYTEESNAERYTLPAYALLDVFASCDIRFSGSQLFTAKLRCENVTDARYESVRLYAMPGRVFTFSLVYSITQSQS